MERYGSNMNKQTVLKLIENGVYQGWLKGGTIQVKMSNIDKWVDILDPRWDNEAENYRIKPKEYRDYTPLEIIDLLKEQGVILLKYNNTDYSVCGVSHSSVCLWIPDEQRMIIENIRSMKHYFYKGEPFQKEI